MIEIIAPAILLLFFVAGLAIVRNLKRKKSEVEKNNVPQTVSINALNIQAAASRKALFEMIAEDFSAPTISKKSSCM